MDGQALGLLFAQTNELSSAIARSEYSRALIPELRLSCPRLELTETEEDEIKKIVFPADLHFQVPVDLRGSKTAYVKMMSEDDSDEDETELVLRSWGLDNLYEESADGDGRKEGDTAVDDVVVTAATKNPPSVAAASKEERED